MKVAVTIDEEGHFQAILVTKRLACLSLLKKIACGNLWDDLYEDALESCDLTEETLHECWDDRFTQFLQQFETRGIFEIIEI